MQDTVVADHESEKLEVNSKNINNQLLCLAELLIKIDKREHVINREQLVGEGVA